MQLPIAYEAIALPSELQRLTDPTMALLMLPIRLEHFGFASHFRRDLLIKNKVVTIFSTTQTLLLT